MSEWPLALQVLVALQDLCHLPFVPNSVAQQLKVARHSREGGLHQSVGGKAPWHAEASKSDTAAIGKRLRWSEKVSRALFLYITVSFYFTLNKQFFFLCRVKLFLKDRGQFLSYLFYLQPVLSETL